MLKNKTERRGSNADTAMPKTKPRSILIILIVLELLCLGALLYVIVNVYNINGRLTRNEVIPTVIIALFSALILGSNIIWHKNDEKNKEQERLAEEARKQFPFAFLNELKQPAVIFRADGNVSWGNDAFSEMAPNDIFMNPGRYNFFSIFSPEKFIDPPIGAMAPAMPSLSDKKVLETLSYMADHRVGLAVNGVNPDASELGDILFSDTDEAHDESRTGFEGEWLLHAYRHEVTTYSISNSQLSPQTLTYFLVVMTDETELNTAIQRYNNDSPLCAYLIIDNLSELISREQGQYRIVSAKVDGVVKKWASELDAIIKEYERDKYIMLFKREKLETQLALSFPILKELQSPEITQMEDFRITASIGISKPNGSLLEKERSAQMALDTALKRGGNQAIVYFNDNEYKSYGGKEDYRPQSHSGVSTRIFADRLLFELQKPETQNVIIMGHQYPDFDSIGSCVGMARLALSYGKKVSIVMPDPVPPAIADAVERLRSIPEYDLIFTVPDICMNSMNPDTVLICCDVNNAKQFEKPDLARMTEKLFIIDHHRSNEFTPVLTRELEGRVIYHFLIIPSASSASELVAEILEHALPIGYKLEPEEADTMFAGLLLDTKQFTKNTQPTTFSAALYLRNNGADPAKAQALFETELSDYQAESYFGTDVFLERDTIVIACEDSADTSPQKRIAAAKTADRLLNVKKIRASFAVARMGSDVFISARSDGSVNVQLIMEGLGGGGHYNAAATSMKATDTEYAIAALCLEIKRYFGEYDATQPSTKSAIKEILSEIAEKRKKRRNSLIATRSEYGKKPSGDS